MTHALTIRVPIRRIQMLIAVSLALSGCSAKSAPPQAATQAPPADSTVAPSGAQAPRPEYGSNAATEAISERSRATEARPQPENAPESSSVIETTPESADDNGQAASPSTGDASAPDSAAHHQVVPRKSRRAGGH
jgi:hypothetical protein